VGNSNKAKSYWKIIREFSEQNVRFLMWWFFLPGLLLFIPSQAIDFLHLSWLYNYFGWLAGLIFLGAGTLLFIDTCYWIGHKVQTIIHLRNLANDEKGVLLAFLNKNARSQTFSISNGAVISLLKMRILQMASDLTYDYGLFDIKGEYIIYPWAFKLLKNNPSLLEGGAVEEKGLPVV
jgi:hypothetical protein